MRSPGATSRPRRIIKSSSAGHCAEHLGAQDSQENGHGDLGRGGRELHTGGGGAAARQVSSLSMESVAVDGSSPQLISPPPGAR